MGARSTERTDWEADTNEFGRRALAATTSPRWVVCGNYWSKLDDLLWSRADTVVWLDLPLPILLWRLVRRTAHQSLRRTELWGTNREHPSSLWHKDSLLLWAIKSQPKNRARYGAAMTDSRWSPRQVCPPSLATSYQEVVARTAYSAEPSGWLLRESLRLAELESIESMGLPNSRQEQTARSLRSPAAAQTPSRWPGPTHALGSE